MPTTSRRPNFRNYPIRTMLLSLVLMLSGFGPDINLAVAAGPGDNDPALYSPVIAEQRDDIFAETEGNLSRYRIDAVFTPADGESLAQIIGTIDLLFVNQTDEAMEELYFRIYPNISSYADGGMSIDAVSVDGDELAIELSVDDTLATVALPAGVEPGESLELSIEFTTTIPTDPIASYGMFSLDRRTGTYALAHWLPLLAGYDPDSGWLLEEPSRNGDPVFSNTALFDVSITAPEALTFVTSGSEEQSTSNGDGLIKRQFLTGPVRDFVMAIDDDFVVESQQVGKTTVNSYFNPGNEAGGQIVLEAGAKSLEVYNRLIGEYPYEEMDLVEVDLGNGAGGVEFPQLMFIGSDYYKGGAATTIPDFLEFIVAHEVGHQWFYALIGNNQYDHAFIDEGLTNFMTTVYFGEVYGADTERMQVNYNLKSSYFSLLFDGLDAVADQPADDFASQRAYGAIIYGKAALGFEALRDEIGADAFYAALQQYLTEYRFEVASPGDLKAVFEETSGQDLDEFWRHWFEAAEGRDDFNAADLAVLLRELGR